MKQKIPIIIFLSIFLQTSTNSQGYDSLIESAKVLFGEKKYCQSADVYAAAFRVFGGKGYVTDRYQAAKAYISCGNIDSAFFHLFKVADKSKFLEFHLLTTDAYFTPMHTDNRWATLLKIINPKNEIYNDSLSKVLLAIRKKDQEHRLKLDNVRRPYGVEPSDEFKALLKVGAYNDSLNLIAVTAILDKYGWLSVNEVGSKANSTLWLVIQHADRDVALQAKYLLMMREATKNGKALPSELAYLEDRVLKNQGKKQMYGTQSFLDETNNRLELWPVEDPVNLNKRRLSVGLSEL